MNANNYSFRKIFQKSSWHMPLMIILILIVFLSGLVFWKKQADHLQNSIKIGIIGHFSGEYAEYGIPMRKAVELAIADLNQKTNPENPKFELISEDDHSNASDAVTAMNKLVVVDNVDYIISAQVSAVAASVAPIAQKNQKLMMITLASAPNLTNAGDFIFTSMPPDDYQATKMIDFINNNLKSKKVAGLYLNTAYGIGIKNIINQNKKTEIVANEIFEPSSTDFKTQLLKIKVSDADTLVIVAINEYPLILKQINELGLNMKIITSETFKDDSVLSNSALYAEGVSTTFFAKPKDNVDFGTRYQAKFKESPSAYGAYAYDGLMALAKAIEDNPEKTKLKDTLLKINFEGASGKVGFSPERTRTGSEYSVYTVKSGQFVEVK